MPKTVTIFQLSLLVWVTNLWGQQPAPTPVPPAAVPPTVPPAEPPVSPSTPERSSQAETIERAGRDLSDPKEETRLGAAKLLGKYKTSRSLAFLGAALDDKSVRVRRAVVVSFSEFLMDGIFTGDRKLLEKFVSKIGDEDVEIRRQVSQMLPRLSYGLFRSNMQIVEINGRKVYRSMPQALSPAIVSIAQRSFLDSDPIVRQNMIKYYYTLRISLPPLTLERLLGDEDRGVRMAALDRVTSIPPHNAVFLKLKDLASHEDSGVRQKVATIARSSSHPLARQILRTLRNDEDPFVMSMAVISLARLGEAQPDAMVAKVRAFLLGSTSTSNQVISLVHSIAAFTRNQARDTFHALTEHDSSKIRKIAWERYLNYDNAMAQPKSWLPALQDRDQKIRESIASLAHSRAASFNSEVMSALIESPHDDVRRFAAHCLTLVPVSVSEEFSFDLLIDEKLEVRVTAIKSIGQRRPKNWEVIMGRSLLDDHFIIQRAALEALLNAPAKGVPLLINFARKNTNSPITGAIRTALARRNIVIP